MKVYTLILSSLLVVSAFAAENPSSHNKPQSKKEPAKSAKVEKKVPRKPSSMDPALAEGDLLPREIREQVFGEAELEGYIQEWDEFDRDRLIMAIWKKPISDVKKKFPSIPPERLEKASLALERILQ